MEVETQRSNWWSAHEQLRAEVTGRRPHRFPTGFKVGPGPLLGVVGVLTVAGALWPTYPDRDFSPRASALVGAALALIGVAAVGASRQGTLGTGRPPAGRFAHWDQRARAVALLAAADPEDPTQTWWAADLARRVAAESHLIAAYGGLALLMLGQALDPVEVSFGWLSALVCATTTTGAVVWAVQDSRARAYLRWHGASAAPAPR